MSCDKETMLTLAIVTATFSIMLDIGADTDIVIKHNVITNSRGVASCDLSTFACLMVTTYNGTPIIAEMIDNSLVDCTSSVAFGI